MKFESLLVFILFKFKNRPNISGIRVVNYKQVMYECNPDQCWVSYFQKVINYSY